MLRVGPRACSAVVLVVCVALGFLAAAPATPAGAEPTGGCRPVGGGPVSTAGPNRATVVVDTGSGPVWSACITFDGTISGIEALELATSTIDGLAPVYEVNAGTGRAVCRLLGVGNDPPDCLTKSVEYWAYFRNGQYSRVGGSSAVVRDGDVEGWSFSRGTAPRAATSGTEAVPLSAVPTTTTTSPPATPSTAGPGGGAGGPSVPPGGQPGQGEGGGSPSTGGPSGGPADGPSGGGAPGAGTGVPGGQGDDPAGDGDGPDGGSGGVPVGESGDGRADGRDGERSGAGAAAEAGGDDATVTISTGEDGDGSSVASMLGFGGALALAGIAVVLVRRRRLATSSAHLPGS